MQRFPGFPLAALVLAAVLAAPAATAQKSAARGVTTGTFGGFPEALTLEARKEPVKLVLVPAAGGRVAFFGREGRNFLWEGTGSGDSKAGAYTDIGPDTANLGPRPAITDGAYDWSAPRAFAVRLRSAEEQGVSVAAGREATLDPETGEAGLLHRMKNIGQRQVARSFLERIQVPRGGFVLLPVNAKSRFPAKWSARREEGGRAVYDGRSPSVEGVKLLDDVLVAATTGPGGRIGTDGDAQWLAYVRDREMLVIHFPAFGTGIYAQGGNTAEAAWNADFVTLMPLSPEVQLREGKSYDFPTKWMIIPLDAPVTTHEEARAAAALVPSSPFL
ncbi:MAG: hypothetical protein ACKVYV_18030 [Limisphaerales bacterium]